MLEAQPAAAPGLLSALNMAHVQLAAIIDTGYLLAVETYTLESDIPMCWRAAGTMGRLET